MRKSGLHKRISFIFEGVPIPENTAKEPLAVEQGEAADEPVIETGQEAATPAKVVTRLKPVPKTAFREESSLLKKIKSLNAKKTATRSDANSANHRQKIMTALVGVLSVVFLAVLAVSFGGVGQIKAATVSAAVASTATAEEKPQIDPESWVIPRPLPEQMRNPLVPSKEAPLAAGGNITDGPMQITGIVYSETRPSVIIDGEVVLEGQVFKGATVVKVARDAVDFEKDGKRWIQHVR